MIKIFKKEISLYWLIPVIILVADFFFVYFGRIYYPKNFHPQTVSFMENYIVVIMGLLFMVGVLAFTLLCLLLIIGLPLSIFKSWNPSGYRMSIFKSWNPSGYRTIKDYEDIKKQKNVNSPHLCSPSINNNFHYEPKFRKEITDHILLETFDDESEFFKAVKSNDYYIAKTKEELIVLLNIDGNMACISVGVDVCILKGITIQKKKEEIIREIEQLEDFKWIRVSYIRTDLTAYDIEKFERYKIEGFPKY